MADIVTLKQLHQAITSYLLLHGDKEILSVGTYNGSAPIGYELHVCDIYDGPMGTNPFTGKDSIKLYKQSSTKEPAIQILAVRDLKEKTGLTHAAKVVADNSVYGITGKNSDDDCSVKIVRNGIETKLTDKELFQAYLAYEKKSDMDEVRGQLNEALCDDEELVKTIADDYRHNVDCDNIIEERKSKMLSKAIDAAGK